MPRESRHPTDADGPTGPGLRRNSGARSFDWVDAPTNRAWSDVAHERLLATTAAVTSDGEPFLDEIPRTPRAERVLLDWCVHLVERLGGRGALEMASYYRDIGWIGDEPHDTIRERVVSFTVPADFEDAPTEEDHVRSFSYVARLSAMTESE
ncbi:MULTISPECIES: FlaD/FlaE family flagellar protein [unclassified Haloferax]|uniref:FlaD/FlaE family flagellar protein n=1 Tax=Haloferax TaxID=2251 RepID=UPI0002B06F71|nr:MULTISPECIES: FlaD/FlaE family flagellar protein [unclassified Haloferax]ELZ60267.1 fla cluster protein FlaD2 [Haloferax sp. ATCC BAA-646]ELZ64479.1 fla cluster protein FlaD2 [Haloferax sp. ATCC BAA-645]ELZ69686.1 fla cluster protein FlaD2 [Haloferax sp. ATCC BAA-644]